MSAPLSLAADTLGDFLFNMRLLAMSITSFNLNYDLPLMEYGMAAFRSICSEWYNWPFLYLEAIHVVEAAHVGIIETIEAMGTIDAIDLVEIVLRGRYIWKLKD